MAENTNAGSLSFSLTDFEGLDKTIDRLKKLQERLKDDKPTKEFKKNIENIDKQLRGLSKTLGNSVVELRNSMAIIGAGFGTAIYGMDKFLSSTANSTNKLQGLSDVTGIGVRELQKFGKAGEVAGVSSEQAMGQIASLQKQITDIKLGRGDALGFMRMGIDPYRAKSALDVAKQIYAVTSRAPAHARGGILGMMGLDEGFMRTMKQASTSMEAFNKIALSGKEVAKINKMGESLRRLKVGFGDLKDKAVAKLAPEMNRFFEKAFDYLLRNSDKIIDAISMIAKWVGEFVHAVGNAVGLLGQLAMSKNMFKGIAIAVGVLAASFMPITAAVVGLLLLLDDVAVWKAGGKSLFGDFYSGIDKFIEKMKNLAEGDIFANLFEGVKDLGGDMFGAFKKMTEGIGLFKASLVSAGVAFVAFKALDFLGIAQTLRVLASSLMLVGKAGWALASNPVIMAGLAVAGVADLAIRGKESIPYKGFETAKEFLGFSGGGDTPPAISNPDLNPVNNSTSTSSSRTTNSTVTINVNSADEAVRIKRELDSQTEMDTVYNNMLVLS